MSGTPDPASSLRLRLPLEVVERIFELACEEPQAMPLEPAPPSPPATLLLVSKGILDLVFPHYYRSITLQKASDWSSFFDPDRGLFVVGERAERRRNAVIELTIRWEVIPIDTDRVHPLIAQSAGDPNKIDDYYVPVATDVRFPNLVRVCLTGGPDRELIRAAQSVAERDLSRRLWASIPRTVSADNLTGLVSNVVGDRVGGALSRKLKAKRAEIYRNLLSSSPIKTVHLTLRHDDLRHIYALPCPKATLYIHTSPQDFEDHLCDRSYAGASRPDAVFTLVDLSCSDQDIAVVGLSPETRTKLSKVATSNSCKNMHSVDTLADGSLAKPVPFIAS